MTPAPQPAASRLPRLTRAYLEGELPTFFEFTPQDLPQVLRRERDIDRARLSRALRAYHSDLGLEPSSDKRASAASRMLEKQLQLLAHPESKVVVAGQQAGLLGGPAYSVHKAADAILLSRQLSEEARPVLPVFWVASQDHDAEEVASTSLLDLSEREYRPRLVLPAGVPVGRVAWQGQWSAQLLALIDDFDAPQPHKERVRQDLNFAFAGRSYADVFARLMHRLLGEYGLLVLDPLHPALAKLMAPALAQELARPLAGPQAIEDAAKQLQARGYLPQLRRPAGATNVFIEEEGGQRRLLRVQGRTFSAECDYTQAQLQEVLAQDPSRLTPAAGLRPIIQDTLLPTAAFVVGPGELAYAAELRGVYALHGLQQPVFWPRLSVTWLEPNVARLLEKYHLSAQAFQAAPDESVGRSLAAQDQLSALADQRLETLRGDFTALAHDLAALDPTLRASVQRSEQRTLARLERHRLQAFKALARAENDRTTQLTRLKKHLLPAGQPQEREMNFLTYLLKHGQVPLQLLLSQTSGATVELKIP